MKKGDPLDFLTTPSTHLKRIWPKPKDPPGFPTTVHLCNGGTIENFYTDMICLDMTSFLSFTPALSSQNEW
jgi:hypothetical protein